MAVTDERAAGPDELAISRAIEMYLDKRAADSTDRTQRFYRNRLGQFEDWCEANGIDAVGELDGWDLEQFASARRSDLAPTSLKAQMTSVRLLLQYCEQIDALPQGFHDKVSVPSVSREQESSDVRLEAQRAESLLEYCRETPTAYGTVEHAALEVFWTTGCRIGGLRALDREDFDADRQYLDFRNRPDTDTRLKNGDMGERAVAVNETLCDVLEFYVERERWDKADDFGREPLFTTRQGRPSPATIRAWAYLGTHPCVYRDCPHGNDKQTCDYRHRNHASKCPSAMSPHAIRTGSITWQLNEGVPAEVVAERVNASLSVIERHYDAAGRLEKLDERRREHTETLDIDTEDSA